MTCDYCHGPVRYRSDVKIWTCEDCVVPRKQIVPGFRNPRYTKRVEVVQLPEPRTLHARYDKALNVAFLQLSREVAA